MHEIELLLASIICYGCRLWSQCSGRFRRSCCDAPFEFRNFFVIAGVLPLVEVYHAFDAIVISIVNIVVSSSNRRILITDYRPPSITGHRSLQTATRRHRLHSEVKSLDIGGLNFHCLQLKPISTEVVWAAADTENRITILWWSATTSSVATFNGKLKHSAYMTDWVYRRLRLLQRDFG